VVTARLGGVQSAATAACAAGGRKKGEDEVVAQDLSDLHHVLDEDEVMTGRFRTAGRPAGPDRMRGGACLGACDRSAALPPERGMWSRGLRKPHRSRSTAELPNGGGCEQRRVARAAAASTAREREPVARMLIIWFSPFKTSNLKILE
jgi:hypothetical protein